MFSEFLVKFRKNHGLTQNEVANKIDVSNSTYSRYENSEIGKISISFITKFRDTFIDILTEEELKILNTMLSSTHQKYIVNNIEKIKYEENESFSKFLVKFRKNHGLTQSEIANKIGIIQNNYSLYETGKINKISISFITKFHDTFMDILTEEELEILNTMLSSTHQKYIVNNIEGIKYEDNESFSKFLVKFRKNHGLTQSEIANRIGISQAACGKYESGKHKLRNSRIVRKFRDTFLDILTEEELKILDNYISLPETCRNNSVDNIEINLGLIVKSVRERNYISLRKMGKQLGLSSTYINNAELGVWGFSDNNLLNFYTHYQELLTTEEKGQIYDYLINNYPQMIHETVKNLIIDNHLLSTLIASKMKLQEGVTSKKTYHKK